MLGKILRGRYELLEKIGGGGMAIVYKAKCHLLKRFVAVKILRPELVENEEFVHRFKRESQSAASLSHPHIVNVYDVGQEDEIHYIVMEFVDGQTLKEYIKDKKGLDSEEAIRVSIQICSALSHAHRNNIIHRDIKPQNILINEEGNVKVADFGIARAVSTATVTIAGTNIIGSVHYFSPEQARGGYVDKKSDIYSLGIVLYEMVTGVVPFEGDSAISVALKHIQDKVTPPGEINPDIPKSIQYIIEKAIEKDLEKRYEDTDAMKSDLKRAIKNSDGNYIQRENINNQNTQVIAPVGVDSIKKKKRYNKTGKNVDKNTNTNTNINKKRIHILWTALAVLFIILILSTAFFIGRSIWIRNFVATEVEVPQLIGLTEEAAESLLNSKNLGMNIRDREYHREIPDGEIISQDPAPGMSVKIDNNVNVIISRGIRTVTVPNVVNKPRQQAETMIRNEGLIVGELEYEFSDIPTGYVVEQSIDEGTSVNEDTEIILVISKGPETQTVLVGTYTGYMEMDSRDMIENDNLKVDVIREHNEERAQGIVFKQEPEPGINVEEGRTIKIWVSLGPKEPVLVTKQLRIVLDTNNETVEVKVIREDNVVIHNEYHIVENGPVIINIEGSGQVDYSIFIDGVEWYNSPITVDFDKREGN